MPQGIQVWDAAGTLILDTSQRVLKYVVEGQAIEGTTTDIAIAPDATSSVVAAAISNFDRDYTPRVVITPGNARVDWPSGSNGYGRAILVMEY
jgi:hypothetical protein